MKVSQSPNLRLVQPPRSRQVLARCRKTARASSNLLIKRIAATGRFRTSNLKDQQHDYLY